MKTAEPPRKSVPGGLMARAGRRLECGLADYCRNSSADKALQLKSLGFSGSYDEILKEYGDKINSLQIL